jgi:hypothetical protein
MTFVQSVGFSKASCLGLALPLLLALLAAAPCAAGPSEPNSAPGGSSSAAAKPAPDGLDQNKVHYLYNEGEFDMVIAIIEEFTRNNKTYSLEDSNFIAKHLAVVYTANPATREKGKRYMFQLLEKNPAARLVDMFVSDEIDRIFQKVKEEYVERRRQLGLGRPSQLESNRYAVRRLQGDRDSTGGGGPPPPEGRNRPGKQERSGTAYWLAGGVAIAAVAAAGATYFLIGTDKGEDKVYVLP